MVTLGGQRVPFSWTIVLFMADETVFNSHVMPVFLLFVGAFSNLIRV